MNIIRTITIIISVFILSSAPQALAMLKKASKLARPLKPRGATALPKSLHKPYSGIKSPEKLILPLAKGGGFDLPKRELSPEAPILLDEFSDYLEKTRTYLKKDPKPAQKKAVKLPKEVKIALKTTPEASISEKSVGISQKQNQTRIAKIAHSESSKNTPVFTGKIVGGFPVPKNFKTPLVKKQTEPGKKQIKKESAQKCKVSATPLGHRLVSEVPRSITQKQVHRPTQMPLLLHSDSHSSTVAPTTTGTTANPFLAMSGYVPAHQADLVPCLIDPVIAEKIVKMSQFILRPGMVNAFADSKGNTIAIIAPTTFKGFTACYLQQAVAERLTAQASQLTQATNNNRISYETGHLVPQDATHPMKNTEISKVIFNGAHMMSSNAELPHIKPVELIIITNKDNPSAAANLLASISTLALAESKNRPTALARLALTATSQAAPSELTHPRNREQSTMLEHVRNAEISPDIQPRFQSRPRNTNRPTASFRPIPAPAPQDHMGSESTITESAVIQPGQESIIVDHANNNAQPDREFVDFRTTADVKPEMATVRNERIEHFEDIYGRDAHEPLGRNIHRPAMPNRPAPRIQIYTINPDESGPGRALVDILPSIVPIEFGEIIDGPINPDQQPPVTDTPVDPVIPPMVDTPIAPAQPADSQGPQPTTYVDAPQNNYAPYESAQAASLPYQHKTDSLTGQKYPENSTPKRDEQPYYPYHNNQPRYAENSGNYPERRGGSASPGQLTFPAAKSLTGTPFKDTKVTLFRNAFGVLSPSEFAKKRKAHTKRKTQGYYAMPTVTNGTQQTSNVPAIPTQAEMVI
jgi:hypothetical protein